MRKNYMKSLTLAAFVLVLTACGNSDSAAPETEDAAAEYEQEAEIQAAIDAEREAEVQAAIDAEREALLNVGKDREDDAEEDIVEEEEEDTSDGYPQNATSPEYIPSEWESDRVMTSADAFESYRYGEVTDFDTFKAKVNSVTIEPSDTGVGNQIRAQIVYNNYEDYDIPIEDVFNVLVDGEQLHNMSITSNLGEPMEPVLLAEHNETIILTANDPNYTFQDEDNVRFTLIRVHSPFNPESYGRYHSDSN